MRSTTRSQKTVGESSWALWRRNRCNDWFVGSPIESMDGTGWVMCTTVSVALVVVEEDESLAPPLLGRDRSIDGKSSSSSKGTHAPGQTITSIVVEESVLSDDKGGDNGKIGSRGGQDWKRGDLVVVDRPSRALSHREEEKSWR